MNKGRIPVLVALAVATISHETHANELIESSCAIVAQNDGEAHMQTVPGLKVLGHSDKPLKFEAEPGIKLIAIACERSEARFVITDAIVPQSGLPLYVSSNANDGEHAARTVSLDLANGSFRIRLVEGKPWSSDEKAQIIKLLEELNRTLPTDREVSTSKQ